MEYNETMKIYFDGGCKPNPGKMEIAVVIDGAPPLSFHERLAHGTNNEAEWIALLWAMEIALAYQHKKTTFVGDSNLVVNQALGLWRVKHAPLLPYLAEFQLLREKFSRVQLEFVRREHNLAGHHIEHINKGRHGNTKSA